MWPIGVIEYLSSTRGLRSYLSYRIETLSHTRELRTYSSCECKICVTPIQAASARSVSYTRVAWQLEYENKPDIPNHPNIPNNPDNNRTIC
jgi:hypothetical protein